MQAMIRGLFCQMRDGGNRLGKVFSVFIIDFTPRKQCKIWDKHDKMPVVGCIGAGLYPLCRHLVGPLVI